MVRTRQAAVTRLLQEVQSGNSSAFDELFALVYEEMHERAHWERRRWHRDFTLNTTALVHEAYLRLVDQTQGTWESRAHFACVAAKVMRHLLIDYARRQRAQKRGGDQARLPLEEMSAAEMPISEEQVETLVTLDDALERLAHLSPRQSQIVECRFFGGMTNDETAAALGVSPATVKRGWNMAQAWLRREMEEAKTRG